MNGLVDQRARLVDAASGEVLQGQSLRVKVDDVAGQLDRLAPGVVLARMGMDFDSVVRYLGAFSAGRPIALLDPALDAQRLGDLVTRFRPAAVLGADPDHQLPPGYGANALAGLAWERRDPGGASPHPDLAVLLPTSGSTGNPKLVRLSRAAVEANAAQIVTALGIDGHEIAPTSLPLHYSYGLSILNSHLVAGATVVIEASGILGRGFWRAFHDYGATSLAGVPYHYEMLRRLRFDPAKYPTLRTLTQAGGRLAVERVAEFAEQMAAVGGQMFVMYGQTEAAPRMATMPADRLREKLGSAGLPLAGGRFTVQRDSPDGPETAEAGVVGEVIYRGPNVMMGYAETEAELAGRDVTGGRLATGDVGYLDADGFLFLTGRVKRIGKIFGNRVNLDDIEGLVAGVAVAAAVADGDRVIVWLEDAADDACRRAAALLSERLHLHPSGFDVRPIPAIPLLGNGKLDYTTLAARA
jgi:acyl-CoA synthetase (AMP-forming)/AMP-acid ligase II